MIEYVFRLQNGSFYHFAVDPFRPSPLECPEIEEADIPAWAKLEFHQCSNCPLKADESPYCPAALDLVKVIYQFKGIQSHAKAILEVRTFERTYQKEGDVQTGLRSLIGVIMATGACPILSQMKSQAIHHLPFATPDETLLRAIGLYLLRQYFVSRDGGEPDWHMEKMNQFYEEVQVVNRFFKKRIEGASEKDASANAMVSLFHLALSVSISLEEQLGELKPLVFPENDDGEGNLLSLFH